MIDAYVWTTPINSFTYARSFPRFGLDTTKFQHVTRWVQAIEARPAVQKALALEPPGT